MRLASILLLASLLTQAKAEELCGPADQQVCLQSTLHLSITGISVLLRGTAAVLLVPGLQLNGSLEVIGSPEAPYRFANQGTLDDHQGGTWITTPIAEDERGITALAFIFDSELVSAPISLSIEDFRLCQRISDGPGEVLVSFSMLIEGGKQKVQMAQEKHRIDDFQYCSANAGNLPLQAAGYKMYVINTQASDVALQAGELNTVLAPGQQLVLDSTNTSSPFDFSSSMPLPLVCASEANDIDLVGLTSANHQTFIIPHLAHDQESWVNSFIFANSETTRIDWHQGSTMQSIHSAGAHELIIEHNTPPERDWAYVLANRPINGFFKFARRDGQQGSAWVEPIRSNANGTISTTTLYLPHVAADRVSFWTGYSLANTHSSPLNVNMQGYDDSGTLQASENFQIPAFGNDIGVIGQHHLIGHPEVAWVRISADAGIAGVQLLGARVNPNLAGFLLPDEGSDQLAFPLLRTDEDFWSGIALLNPGNASVSGSIQWKNAQGTVLATTQLQLAALNREIFQAPVGATQAIVHGTQLIGFCLIGENHSDRLGAYTGLSTP